MRWVVTLTAVLLSAACGDTGTPEPLATATTAATLETVVVTSTAPPTTTTLPPATTESLVQTYEATVSWDGSTCTYDGPTSVIAGDTVDFTYRNDSAGPADYEVAYLATGSTIEDLDAYTGSTISRGSSEVPAFLTIVSSYPGGRGSVGAGEAADEALVLEIPRVHALTCFGGQQSGDQSVDVAATGIDVTE